MTYDFAEDYEGAADETVITSSNSNYLVFAGSPVIDTAHFVRGTRCGRYASAGAITSTGRTFTARNQIYDRIYFLVEASPAATMYFMGCNSGGTVRAQNRLNTDRTIGVRNASTLVYTFSTVCATSTMYRLERHIDLSAGTQVVSLFLGHSETALETSGSVAAPSGVTADRVAYGNLTGVTGTTIWIDDATSNNDSLPGPSLYTVSPASIASAESFGTATLSPGAVDVAPTSVASAEAFGTATVTQSGGGAAFVAPTGIPTGEAFGTATVTPGPVDVSPASIGTGETFGAAVITPGPVDVAPTSITTGEAFGAAVITPGGVEIGPTGAATAEAFGAATIEPGPVDVAPTGITTGEAWGVPVITPGPVDISPASIGSGEGWGTPSLGAGQISPSGIESGEAWGTPTIGIALRNVTLTVTLAERQARGVLADRVGRSTLVDRAGRATLEQQT